MSAGIIGLLWWLNPVWLDEHASWRAPLVADAAPMVSFPKDSEALGALFGDDTKVPAKPLAPPQILLFPFGRVTGKYNAGAGGEVRDTNGLRLTVPPGSLARSGTLSMTPVARLPHKMRAHFIGPIYDIRLDDQEQLSFRQPATLTLPYAPSLDPQGASLVVWENGRWKPVTSSIDRATHTITASIQHASLWALATTASMPVASAPIALGAVLWTATNGSARGAARSMAWALADGYETTNFQFHYYKEGDLAVPTDAAYLAAVGSAQTGKPVQNVPLYVQDLGTWLEGCRAGFEDLGLNVPEVSVMRYDVFLTALDGSYGASGLGGPLLLPNDLISMAQGNNIDPADLMRSVCAHELAHVAQANHSVTLATAEALLPSAIGPQRLWWIEMTAEYIADYYWKSQGHPLGAVSDRYRIEAALPGIQMVGAVDPDYYAYSSFLSWLDQTEGAGSGLRWIRAVDNNWTASLSSIDAAAKATFEGRGLQDLLRDFAFDFYHYDLWRGLRFPLFHKGTSEALQFIRQAYGFPRSFMVVARAAPAGVPGVEQGTAIMDPTWKSRSLQRILPMTARAVYFGFDGLPKERQAKLVIHVEKTSGKRVKLALYMAQDRAIYRVAGGRDYRLPLGGELSKLEEVSLDGPEGFVHTIDHLGSDGAPNRISLVVINENLEGSNGGLFIERWLLLAPESIEFERRGDFNPNWELRWPEVELKDEAPAFETYRVYRKPSGAPDEAFEAVLDTRDELVSVAAPDGGAYEFTVRVVDRLGNESANAPNRNISFTGKWSGKLRLVDGALLEPLLDYAGRRIEEGIDGAEREIRQETDPDRKRRRREKLNDDLDELNQIRKEIRPFLETWSKAENTLRAGIPVSFEIREVDTQYQFQLTGIASLDPEMSEWIKLERLGKDRIGFPDPGDLEFEFSPPMLRMHRFDPSGKRPAVIRTDEWRFTMPLKPDGKINIAVSWEFTRTD